MVALWLSVQFVPTGYRGVVWHRFGGGTDMTGTLEPGVHYIAPWDRMFPYPISERQVMQRAQVLDATGTGHNLTAHLKFRLKPEGLPLIHRSVGPEVVYKLVVPEMISVLRAEMGRRNGFGADDTGALTTAARDALSTSLQGDHVEVIGLDLKRR